MFFDCPEFLEFNTMYGECGAATEYTIPSASDNCSFVPATLIEGTYDYFYPVGTTTHVYIATDDSGNSSLCSFDIIVTDDDAPGAHCKNITVQLDDTGQSSISSNDVNNDSSDNCSDVSLALDNTSFDCMDVGSALTVVLTVTDEAGNSSSCESAITVKDNEAPVVHCEDFSIALG